MAGSCYHPWAGGTINSRGNNVSSRSWWELVTEGFPARVVVMEVNRRCPCAAHGNRRGPILSPSPSDLQLLSPLAKRKQASAGDAVHRTGTESGSRGGKGYYK